MSDPRTNANSNENQERDGYVDQGHESDPSELLRPAVLFGTSPPQPRNLLGQDMYPIRRANRSMSLSMSPSNPWYNDGIPPAPTPARHHREVVPYSQEWRVILRSPPRGRTVLYNPQMQSLVVQTTVGLDPHPVSLRNDSNICALCRRPLDLDTNDEEEGDAPGAAGFMDTNYFRMLADANIAISRRATLQDEPSAQLRTDSPIGTPTSSSRASLDLDTRPTVHDDSRDNVQESTSSPHLSHNALNQGYYDRFFVETMKLGRGFRGSVFLCQHILDGIHLGEYAIKKVAVGDNHDWLVQMLREVHLLERLHHPNIVSYKHAWLENHQLYQFSPEVTCLFILMECANGGNLEEYIERAAPEPFTSSTTTDHDPTETGSLSKDHHDPAKPMSTKERLINEREQRRKQRQGSLPPFGNVAGSVAPISPATNVDTVNPTTRHYLSNTEIWSFFFDICEGLAHLHRLGIIHRDLKPPNLLLSYSNSKIKGSQGERPRILITDFGECEILDQTAKRDRTGATGTLEFLAPELLAVDDNGRYMNEFSFKGDMWSLGMVLYYLCYSRLPYTQIEDVDILREEIRGIKSFTLPPDDERVIPEELKILIRVLLSPEKSKRPSCDEILKTLSHQRDRMMHGDMDSPTTPIGPSSSLQDPPSGHVDDFDGDSTTGQESVLQDSASLRDSDTDGGSRKKARHPQLYKPAALVGGRRRSRVTLVTEPSARTVHSGHMHDARDGTITPSRNLHKKVKPLGLGLRHMLRRRMMLLPSTGLNRAPKAPSPAAESERSLSLSVRGSPSSFGTRSPGMSQYNAHLFRQQQGIRDRQEAAKTRESTLGLAMHLPPVSGSRDVEMTEDGRHDASKSRKGKAPVPHRLTMSDSNEEGKHSSSPLSISPSHSSPPTSPGKKKHLRDLKTSANRQEIGFSDSESTDSDVVHLQRKTGSHTFNNKSIPSVGKSLARFNKNVDHGYWTHLASNHQHRNRLAAEEASSAREMNRANEDDELSEQEKSNRESVFADPLRDNPDETAADGLSRHGKADEALQAVDYEGDIDLTSPIPDRVMTRTRRHLRRRSANNSNNNSITEKSVSAMNSSQSRRQSTSYSPTHSSSTPSAVDDFSVHFMFTSLMVRIWFCLRICHPILVRPLVLYPILVLTVIWDRYLLSIWNSTQEASSRAASSQRSQTQKRRQILNEGEKTRLSMDEDDMVSRSTDQITIVGDDHMDQTRNSDPRRPGEPQERSISTRSGSGLASETQGGQGFSVPLIWQAGLMGVGIQLFWIGVVWLFSREGICVL
ncbi:putative serine/threonine-protein kinase iks1 [Gryganskiella cystojenkinii]|nr:putative serine/threonine-protein kinase iks1 [Gryganskiella cystojenkinii]